MKTLHLLRHAKAAAESDSVDDHDRPLTKRGRRAAEAVARHLIREKILPDLVLCSTSLRTRETLAPILARVKPRRVVFDRDLYLAPAVAILDLLRGLEESLTEALVVGHNPGLQELALMLLERRAAAAPSSLASKFPTGALASFRCGGTWRRLAPGSGTLVAYVTPRELEDKAS